MNSLGFTEFLSIFNVDISLFTKVSGPVYVTLFSEFSIAYCMYSTGNNNDSS